MSHLKVTNILVMLTSPPRCYLVPLTSKYLLIIIFSNTLSLYSFLIIVIIIIIIIIINVKVKVQNIFHGRNNITLSANCKYRTAATIYTLETLLASGTRVGTLIEATIYLQLIQNRYMFRSFTVLQCSHQHCLQPVASDVEVVGYL